MPETLRSPTLSHKPVPYTVICHKEEDEEEDEEEGGWSDDAEGENTRKNLINVNRKVFVAVNGNGLERTGLADCEEKQDVDKLKKRKDILLKNGVRLHQRRTMEVKEVQEEEEKQRQGAETVL